MDFHAPEYGMEHSKLGMTMDTLKLGNFFEVKNAEKESASVGYLLVLAWDHSIATV